MRFLASFITQGRMQAIAVAATALMLSLLFPPLSLLAAAVVALVTLRLGWREGLNTLLAASLAAGLLGAVVLGNFIFPAAYGLLLWLPVWGAALFLRLSRDLGLTLALLTVIGMAGVILVYAVMNDPADFWYQRLQAVFGPVWRQAGVDVALWQPQLVTMARYMTGIMAAGMVSSLALSLIWGRWWQALLYNPGGFRQEFLTLRLRPSLAWFTFALVVLGAFVDGKLHEVLVNVGIVLFVLYVFAGVAVLHAILAARGMRGWLYGLYILMALVPHIFLPLALVGLSDAWFDWRGRFLPAE